METDPVEGSEWRQTRRRVQSGDRPGRGVRVETDPAEGSEWRQTRWRVQSGDRPGGGVRVETTEKTEAERQGREGWLPL